MVELKATMINSTIEAHEGRDVGTIYMSGEYLYPYSYEEVIIIPKGRLAEILTNIDPKLYRKYIFLEKGVKVLYVNLQKAIYGLLRSALLFYLKLAIYLKIIVLS